MVWRHEQCDTLPMTAENGVKYLLAPSGTIIFFLRDPITVKVSGFIEQPFLWFISDNVCPLCPFCVAIFWTIFATRERYQISLFEALAWDAFALEGLVSILIPALVKEISHVIFSFFKIISRWKLKKIAY